MYSMPPVIFENFMAHMVESKYGQAKLRELKQQFKALKDLPYTIVDYVNSIDLVIRKLELNLYDHK